VPAVARAKGVSRQHVQTHVNALVRAGLVAFRDNPSHRRSPLAVLTPGGRATFVAMRRREAALLAALARPRGTAELARARATLRALRADLDRRTKGGDDDATDA